LFRRLCVRVVAPPKLKMSVHRKGYRARGNWSDKNGYDPDRPLIDEFTPAVLVLCAALFESSPATTMKQVFDGLVYGLLTAGVFGWLWLR
jgi:hypothetical protein